VEGCVQWVRKRINTRVFRPGTRVPSIRSLARQQGVSPFTVVEAYERLVAGGELEARKGSGFYVRECADSSRPQLQPLRSQIDFAWLMSHMLQLHGARGPGLGVLPSSWLDGARLGTTL
ncbi:MAG: GntR family transcriptional regulator, partial [Steroidobacteraceae bacterium]